MYDFKTIVLTIFNLKLCGLRHMCNIDYIFTVYLIIKLIFHKNQFTVI